MWYFAVGLIFISLALCVMEHFFSCACESSLCLLWRIIYLCFLPIFDWVGWYFAGNLWDFYSLNTNHLSAVWCANIFFQLPSCLFCGIFFGCIYGFLIWCSTIWLFGEGGRGYTWLCSSLTLASVLNDHFRWPLGDCMQCQALKVCGYIKQTFYHLPPVLSLPPISFFLFLFPLPLEVSSECISDAKDMQYLTYIFLHIFYAYRSNM